MTVSSDAMGWSNWSGNQSAPQARIIQPETEEELRELIVTGDCPLRVVGSGHSFTPIVSTTGSVINLDRMSGVVSVDTEANLATIKAGSRLKDLSPALEEHGVAFKNLGDINVQSFAGATATGTHGTGEKLGCLSSEIVGVRLMKADGDIKEATLATDPDLVRAAQVSVGALGVLLEATLKVRPSYKLHRTTSSEPIEKILDAATERWSNNRNYEFFYVPYSGYGINIFHNETEADATIREEQDDDAGLAAMRGIRDRLKWSPFLRKKTLQAAFKRMKGENTVDQSWRLLASVRNTHFNEMEYHIPVENGLEAFKEVVAVIEDKCRGVFFPIEMRKTAGDAAWLSPFQGGPRISIAVHAAADERHDWFFDYIEPIFSNAGGRPHWGKLHSLGREDLERLYPDFLRFLELRKRFDPDGKFLSKGLAKYWGDQL